MIVNPTGGPALATGGTGDVLLGVITGLLAQGVSALHAAALGAYLHGAAADRLTARRGDTGLLASELLPALPPTIAALRNLLTDDFERELAPAFPDA
jgi:NAD(P)H-hydrate epimerase